MADQGKNFSFENLRVEGGESSKFEERSSSLGEEFDLVFTLPNGVVENMKVRAGQTVQFLKLVLNEKHQLPMESQVLLYNGEEMLDPFSLNDIISDFTQPAQITVQTGN